MNIVDYIHKDGILTDFTADNKEDSLKKLSLLASKINGLPPEKIFQVLWAREQMGSTGVGRGVALPHGLSEIFTKPLILVAKAKQGIEFDSIDAQTVHIIFLILSPLAPAFEGHLKILAILGRLFLSAENIINFMASQTPAEIYNFLEEKAKG